MEFDYELYKKIRLQHYYKVDSIADKIKFALRSIAIGTRFFPDKPVAVMVSMRLNLEWPIEIDSSYHWWADMAAKLKPQIDAIDPSNKFEGLYNVIIKCFADFEPDPWPLNKPSELNRLEGEIWFKDPVLEYALHNVSRWKWMHRLPEDLVDFMKTQRWPENED
jgi:hypothetical protein